MTTPHLDHIGIAVPDLAAARAFYDELMAIVGFEQWFPADDHQFNYGPGGSYGTQLFFYRALDPRSYSRDGIGLQHLAFGVPTRAVVIAAHEWAIERDLDVLHAPRPFPEYGEHAFATYFLDPHGIKLEVVSHEASAGRQTGGGHSG